MRRKTKSAGKGTSVPVDYLKLFREALDGNFSKALKDLSRVRRGPKFEVWGQMFPDEALLIASLGFDEGTAATTVYASMDFDPKKDTMEKVLARCVDVIGDLLATYLDRAQPELMQQFVADSLGAIENVPFDWSPIKRDGKVVFVKVDKANLALEAEAERLLASDQEP